MLSSLVPRTPLLAAILIGLLPATRLHAQPDAVAELSVHAGTVHRLDTPVQADLPSLAVDPSDSYALFEITGRQNRPVPSQIVPGDPHRLLWTLDGETPNGTVRNYVLRRVPERQAPDHNGVTIHDDGQSLVLRAGERAVLAYRYAIQPAPEGVDSVFTRSGFIHPLYSPSEQVLSRIQPPDHYHHYGLWNPWTRARFEGREIDFWNLGDRTGTVRAGRLLERLEGPISGGFNALLEHVDLTATGGEKTALTEQWKVRVWNSSPESENNLIDFTSTLVPATDSALTIKAYRYQGFSLRASERWNDDTARIMTSDGFDKSNANATRARWVFVNGVSEAPQDTSGVLFMADPGNRDFPERLRIWPTGQNNGAENVYINFNPAQDRDWVLEPGSRYVLKYRIITYDGGMDARTAERHWLDFADPPRVTVHNVGALQGARVLVYTKNSEGYVHDNIPFSVDAIRKLGAEYGFDVDASDDPALFTPENLSRYNALIFSNSNNDAFDTDEQRQALQGYVRSGGGFVGIHSASGSERNWPWFSALVGGNFVRHPPSQDFSALVVNSAHPSTSFLGDSWAIENDECYYLDELNPGIRVLLAADLTTLSDKERDEYPGVTFGDRFPIAWYQEFDGGRQWYTAIGHRPEEYRDPLVLRHILGGIQWVVGGSRP